MTSKLVDITAHDGPNYKPLVYFESWRVAILNDDPEVLMDVCKEAQLRFEAQIALQGLLECHAKYRPTSKMIAKR